MTLAETLLVAAAELDVMIEAAHRRFEQSLVEHDAPAEDRDDLRAYERAHLAEWRAITLNDIRTRLLLEQWTPRTVH